MLKKLLLLTLLCFGCESEYFSRIPDYPVALELDVTLTDLKLNPVLGYQTYTSSTIVGRATGFGGVLVFHAPEAFYAYDLSCPNEVKRTIRLSVNDKYQAKCSTCGSVFNILDGTGSPYSGPAKENGYYLRRYTVSQNTNNLYVYK